MVRNLWKVLSGAYSGYRHYGDMVFGRRLLKAVSMAELSLCRGIPVLEAYFRGGLKTVAGAKDLKDPYDFLPEHIVQEKAQLVDLSKWDYVIDPEARVSFEMAFGVGPAEQVRWEQQFLKGLSFPSSWSVIDQDEDQGPEGMLGLPLAWLLSHEP